LPLTVTLNQAAGQPDPTDAPTIDFTVVFSRPVSDFTAEDVTLAGTAGATRAAVSGGGTTYTVAVSGMTQAGTLIATVAAGVAHDTRGTANAASTSTDNSVTYTVPPPLTVTIDQAGGADPTNAAPIAFTVVFSRPVGDFTAADVT